LGLRLVERQPQACGFGDSIAQFSVLDARKLLVECARQGRFAYGRLESGDGARGRLDLANAEANRIDVNADGFQPHHDLAHEQRQLLGPTGRRDVHRQLAAALGAWLGARRDALADHAPPLLAIDRGAG
jgi:hypothetical protein